MLKIQDILDLIKTGEGLNLEFKEKLSSTLGKEICAFANAAGGKIILGVKDDGSIKGIKLSNADKSILHDIARNIDPSLDINVENTGDLTVLSIPAGKDKPYFVNGHCYLRIGSNSQQLKREEIKSFFQEQGHLVFDEKLIKYDFKDFSKSAYNYFVKASGISASKLSRDRILANLGFQKEDKLNYSGVLLFTKDITKYLRNSTVICVLYQGESRSHILDKKEFSQDLVSNYFSAIDFVKKSLNTEYVINDAGPRKEFLELPEPAIKEAIINAFAHRDYYSNAPILVNIYKDKLEIINPSLIDESVKLNDLLKGTYPRNLFLFSCLEKIDLVEKAGSGFYRIKQTMADYKLPMIKIEFTKRQFMVTFQRPDLQIESYETRVLTGIKAQEKAQEEAQEKAQEISLTVTEKKIIDLIKKNGMLSKSEILNLLGLKSISGGFKKSFTKLLNFGIIEPEFKDNVRNRNQKYKLKK